MRDETTLATPRTAKAAVNPDSVVMREKTRGLAENPP